ncbi:MAG: bifunctional diaminohydroxyphosphoribosylaminopyrimidine deaminase/5-amino-6-(5-phosphoribosylamino)uracil reductase RibD [Candidatus Omnitrophica bacterium]|nr:bifunctional diaminohydroxyphosphoribosylaminopyrimidine deaminase/5-amino-6-(5-phosphoribosylamino)uracil reductase RibD [Candidatus Omnitrophota bacterium]MBU4303468.1 bifunctional diaminohydroxyphosphoribosylaminopyrimidine deaminase/5-amino-6-(5-phosphoribosylamino)uracil reductase RibD [Candidatus Omnitrophota bacterium]MBU4467471.1 bifunctional diaminohydroxyphosphoribosylaminopyrimidine deaminase/5-amino-6-(5-phosphoribosylamino)uracil reductase RibD [Candidatus Omnitrophota bacterium]
MIKPLDEYYMGLALKLALKAKGKTSPNPLVGALVVKAGKIIGRGFHAKAGFAHAEIVALDAAGKKAAGATLYVTLEPCAHTGRTPPCINRIIGSGIKEVVVGMIDPNPLNNGKGVTLLKQGNIKVKVGVLEERLKEINESFIKYITTRIPLITVKVAESLDGRIATRTGDSKWITSDKSRAFAHRIRKDYDAIMVGVNTVLRDNPSLNAWFSEKKLIKVIVDSNLSISENSNIFAGDSQVIIITLPSRPGQETENRKKLAAKARILEVKEKAGQINLRDALKKLAQLQISNIIVEGGGTLIGSLFDEKLVDKVLFFISPKIIGGKDAVSSVMGNGVKRVDQAVKLQDLKIRRFGEDLLVQARVK